MTEEGHEEERFNVEMFTTFEFNFVGASTPLVAEEQT